MTDQQPNLIDLVRELRRTVGLFDGAMPISPKQAWEGALAEVAKIRSAWSEFPTDAQVEAAARAIHGQRSGNQWDNIMSVTRNGYRKAARAALEAAHNHTNRKDEA